MIRIGAAAAALLALAACKDRGVVSLHVDDPCGDAVEVGVFLVVDGDCAEASCGGFACRGPDIDGCTALCPSGYCSLAEYQDRVGLDPPPGAHAVVVAFRQADGTEGIACAEIVIEEDGTESSQQQVVGDCCAGADAGVADGGADAAEGT